MVHADAAFDGSDEQGGVDYEPAIMCHSELARMDLSGLQVHIDFRDDGDAGAVTLRIWARRFALLTVFQDLHQIRSNGG